MTNETTRNDSTDVQAESPSDSEPSGSELPDSKLLDPESLREREEVAFSRETETLDRESFESLREQSETDDGAALVGITNDDEAVLLKDTCTGWLAPGGNVASDEDWAAVARREAESWTDVAVELDGVERVRRIDHRVEGGEPSDVLDGPFYVVFFRASPATDETVPVDSDDEDAPDVEWFDEVPEGVDSNHENDVRTFFD